MKLKEIHPEIQKAETIERDFYLSPYWFEASKEKIFADSWQYVGHSNQLDGKGTASPVNLLEGYLNEPLVLTRDNDENLHCLSNVCTHRGNLLVYEPCSKLRQLTCKYHGRSFDLDGQFKFMPEFKEVENFPRPCEDLEQLPLANWGPILFTRLTGNHSFASYFHEMMERMHWFDMSKLKYNPQKHQSFEVNANWALYCENYLEGFHIPFVHKDLNEVLDFNQYETILFSYSNLQLGIAKEGDSIFDLPTNSAEYGKQVAAYYFWVFPNMMFNFYPWGLSLNIVEPTSESSCRVQFLNFSFKNGTISGGAGGDLDTVEAEDEEIVQMVQKGIRSRFYNTGRYAPKREQGTHHFHRLLVKALNC